MTDRPRSRRNALLRSALVAAILAGTTLRACPGSAAGDADSDRPVEAPPQRITEVNGKPAVKLDRNTRIRSGIQVAALSSAPYQDRLAAYGMVLDSTPLADLASSIANAHAQQQMAQARLAASKTAFDRSRGLYRNQQNVSLEQFQTAEATYRIDQAALGAADSQVRTLDATALQAFGPVLAKALLDDAPLATALIGRQLLLVQVTLPPGTFLAEPPRTGTIRIDHAPAVELGFVSLASRIDPAIQGASFLYTVPLQGGVLPGMNVLVYLPSGPPREGVAIPASSIVWWQDRAWIYREVSPDIFVRTQIATDLPTPDGGMIVDRLPADAPGGPRVVVRGAQLLLSEEFRAQIQVEAD